MNSKGNYHSHQPLPLSGVEGNGRRLSEESFWHQLVQLLLRLPAKCFRKFYSALRKALTRLNKLASRIRYRFNRKPIPPPSSSSSESLSKPPLLPPEIQSRRGSFLSPSHEIPRSHRPPPPVSSGRRKALLIGICYEEGVEAEKLNGPHKDVDELKQLLLDLYGYKLEDITTMMDNAASKNTPLEPTRDNIIAQIKELVKGAQPGDRFLFHFSGHSSQTPNKDKSEEDGFDEMIMTSDCTEEEDKTILDDELKRLLVDPLPVGSSLVALFDTCHSGTLLDLPHSRCNRVYVPWISKGRRRTETLQNEIVRENALMPQDPAHYHRESACPCLNTYRLNEKKGRKGSKSYHFLQSMLADEGGGIGEPGDEHHYESWFDPEEELETIAEVMEGVGRGEEGPVRRCASPVAMFCSGFCQPTFAEHPYVISLSSSKDNQSTWEDDKGTSLTKIVVNLLRSNPHPTLKQLMEGVSHEIYGLTRRVHTAHRKLRRSRRARVKAAGLSGGSATSSEGGTGEEDDDEEYETENFQDPEISSHEPLDMSAKFTF